MLINLDAYRCNHNLQHLFDIIIHYNNHFYRENLENLYNLGMHLARARWQQSHNFCSFIIWSLFVGVAENNYNADDCGAVRNQVMSRGKSWFDLCHYVGQVMKVTYVTSQGVLANHCRLWDDLWRHHVTSCHIAGHGVDLYMSHWLSTLYMIVCCAMNLYNLVSYW